MTPKSPRIIAVIQARYSSSRLPGKALLKIGGLSALGHVIHRVKKIQQVSDIVLATTALKVDDVLVSEAASFGAKAWRGSENNVLERVYLAAKDSSADYVLRITADCPVIDPELANELIAFTLDRNLDFATNYTPPTYPDGLDLAMIRAVVLNEIRREVRLKSHLEHVTTYLEENPTLFRSEHLRFHEDLSAYRWTLDNSDDFRFFQELSRHAPGPIQDLYWNEIREIVETSPSIQETNWSHSRNYGHR